MGVEPDEDRRKPDKAVLRTTSWGLGHLDAVGHDPAAGPAACDQRQPPEATSGAEALILQHTRGAHAALSNYLCGC